MRRNSSAPMRGTSVAARTRVFEPDEHVFDLAMKDCSDRERGFRPQRRAESVEEGEMTAVICKARHSPPSG